MTGLKLFDYADEGVEIDEPGAVKGSDVRHSLTKHLVDHFTGKTLLQNTGICPILSFGQTELQPHENLHIYFNLNFTI